VFSITQPLCLEADCYDFDGWNAIAPEEHEASDVVANSWIRYCALTDRFTSLILCLQIQLPPSTPSKHARTTQTPQPQKVLAGAGESHFQSTPSNVAFRGLWYEFTKFGVRYLLIQDKSLRG
jgi:hypothetical protein